MHLEDGPVEHLVYNSIFGCLAAVAVGIGRAHMWHVDEEGHLTSFPLPDEEPAFPDVLLKHVFKGEIVCPIFDFTISLIGFSRPTITLTEITFTSSLLMT